MFNLYLEVGYTEAEEDMKKDDCISSFWWSLRWYQLRFTGSIGDKLPCRLLFQQYDKIRQAARTSDAGMATDEYRQINNATTAPFGGVKE